MSRLLEIEGLDAFHGVFQALFGVSLHVEPGEVVAIIGANGAGKSTLFATIAGLHACGGGAIAFEGRALCGTPAHQIATAGIALVPEGRRLFASLTVAENLAVGTWRAAEGAWTIERVCELFPRLKERWDQSARHLSGGEQQMLAIARALLRNPRLLLIDELSLGLAPAVINGIYAALPAILRSGCAILLVEQDIARALRESARYYCLREGRVILSGDSAAASREAIARAYFGEAEA
ncbi:MAG TPA: ABC transporter ATP-binding protein [Thermopetrobacter sp.]|nr:ABC transporter ATP-binding protein [Thermopetrobacter sp.]